MFKYWEIVQLSDGSFALQSSEPQDEPLVRVEFSEAAEELLNGELTDIAHAMIGAGVQAASFVEESFIEDAVADDNTTLH